MKLISALEKLTEHDITDSDLQVEKPMVPIDAKLERIDDCFSSLGL